MFINAAYSCTYPGFQHRGFKQRGCRRRLPCRGVRGHSRPENFEILSPRKRDFRQSKAKSAFFNISFFKVKMPFSLHQNITKLNRNYSYCVDMPTYVQ